MDKIRVASVIGVRKFLARRQMDAKIKLLCSFHTGLQDISRYSCGYNNTSGTWQATDGPFGGGCVRIASVQGNGIIYGVNFDFSGAFSIGYWSKCNSVDRHNIGVMSGGFSFDLAGNHGDPSGLYLNTAKIGNYRQGSTGWGYNIITRNTANVLKIYVNGSQVYSATTAGTLGIDPNSFSVGSVRYKYMPESFIWYVGDVIVVDGVDFTFGGTRNLVPSAPFTGYEAL